jgi:hypothetical protein
LAKMPAQRFNDLWRNWGLLQDSAAIKTQAEALKPLEEWLASDKPEVVLRAVQFLLVDPEQPGLTQRRAFSDVIEPLTETWANAGVDPRDAFALQAMMLATWPHHLKDGAHGLASLLTSPLSDLTVGRQRQREALTAWRDQVLAAEPAASDASTETSERSFPAGELTVTDSDLRYLQSNLTVGLTYDRISEQLLAILKAHETAIGSGFTSGEVMTAFTEALQNSMKVLVDNRRTAWTWNGFAAQLLQVLDSHDAHIRSLPGTMLSGTEDALKQLRANAGANWHFANFGPNLVMILEAHRKALRRFAGENASTLDGRLGAIERTALDSMHDRLLGTENELLWWGQARYCHILKRPYRRIADREQRLWWMAFEAAKLARGLEVEPAASFLVEVLRQSGDDIGETKPLKEWLDSLLSTLRALQPLPPVAPELAELASADALGLPVTWARLQAAKPGAHALADNLADVLGLPLEGQLDRGQWAAWLFREIQLGQAFGAK